jgi:hypothetical protein
MSWGNCQSKVVLGLMLIGLIQGCSQQEPRGINDLPRMNAVADMPRASALFAQDRSATLATQLGRSAWPATNGAYESPQETVFQEHYYDFQSDAALERFYPYRTFTSFRTGAQQR